MFHDYQLKIDDLYNNPNDNVKKLIPNFFDDEKRDNNNLICYLNLKLYLRLGMKLKKYMMYQNSINVIG